MRDATPITPPTTRVVTTNPLAPSHAPAPHPFTPQPGVITVAWSGWIGEPDESPDGDVPPDHRTWAGTGRDALDKALALALPRFMVDRAVLWLRPHARHVLSDAPSCGSFLRTHEAAVAAGVLGLLIDIDLLITPDMARTRAEHARRLVESLARAPGVAAWAMARADWEGPIGTLIRSLAPSTVPMLRG